MVRAQHDGTPWAEIKTGVPAVIYGFARAASPGEPIDTFVHPDVWWQPEGDESQDGYYPNHKGWIIPQLSSASLQTLGRHEALGRKGLYFAPTRAIVRRKMHDVCNAALGSRPVVPVRIQLMNPLVVNSMYGKDGLAELDLEDVRRRGHDGIVSRVSPRRGWHGREGAEYGVVFPEYVEQQVAVGRLAPKTMSGLGVGALVMYEPSALTKAKAPWNATMAGNVGKIVGAGTIWDDDIQTTRAGYDLDFGYGDRGAHIYAVSANELVLRPGEHAKEVAEAQRRGERVPVDHVIEYGLHKPKAQLAIAALADAQGYAEKMHGYLKAAYEGHELSEVQITKISVRAIRDLKLLLASMAKASRAMASRWGRIFEYASRAPLPGVGRKPWEFHIPAGWEGTTEHEQALGESLSAESEASIIAMRDGEERELEPPQGLTHDILFAVAQTLGSLQGEAGQYALTRFDRQVQDVYETLAKATISIPLLWRAGHEHMDQAVDQAWRQNPGREQQDTPAAAFLSEMKKQTPAGVGMSWRAIGDHRVKLSLVYSERAGAGGQAMLIACGLADKYGVTLSLEVETYDEDDEDRDEALIEHSHRLMGWYDDLGFESASASDYGLRFVRKPGARRL